MALTREFHCEVKLAQQIPEMHFQPVSPGSFVIELLKIRIVPCTPHDDDYSDADSRGHRPYAPADAVALLLALMMDTQGVHSVKLEGLLSFEECHTV